MILVIILAVFSFILLYGYVWKGYSSNETYKFLTLSSITGLALLIFAIGIIQIPKIPDFNRTKMERNVIQIKVKRLENSSNNIINGDIGSLESTYKEAINMNERIIRARYWSDSLWVNWFFNDKIGDIDLIEVNN